ncbi:DUF433 domain-containing protein [Leptolyngbya sp. KIOST-1]|uniref:DUF433 domain-containing protein n=1 Tax=Leptolyngbya sp. KIOST-1 TaxID=1229172 RepID=UPI0021F1A15E|nr:DUF433 domain-containing protein [Leptolyngbya sp. KIOST-1]
MPVWDLVQYRRLGATDAKILEAYPQLTAIDLANAWHYVDIYRSEIEAAIRENEAA